MTELLRKKQFVGNYPTDVLDVMNAMSFDLKQVSVAGSMALRSQLYAGDYDMFEIVKLSGNNLEEAVEKAVKGIQDIVNELKSMNDVFIGDIKGGEIEEWKVISGAIQNHKVVGFDAPYARHKLHQMVEDGIISSEDCKEALSYIKDKPSIGEWLVMEKEIRFHVIRWMPIDIQKGYVMLRGGRKYTLEEAITSPSLFKIDAVAWVQNNRFTDFSNIYSFKWKHKTLNPVKIDAVLELKKNIALYEYQGKYFKLAKRIFAVAKQEKKGELIRQLTEMFNSDLGRIYNIMSDLGTIQFLLENEKELPNDKIEYELDNMRGRLGNIYEVSGVDTPYVIGRLMSMTALPRTIKGRRELLKDVEKLMELFDEVLQRESKRELEDLKLLPLPKSLQV